MIRTPGAISNAGICWSDTSWAISTHTSVHDRRVPAGSAVRLWIFICNPRSAKPHRHPPTRVLAALARSSRPPSQTCRDTPPACGFVCRPWSSPTRESSDRRSKTTGSGHWDETRDRAPNCRDRSESRRTPHCPRGKCVWTCPCTRAHLKTATQSRVCEFKCVRQHDPSRVAWV
jgi:hypothetical protein